MAKSKKIILSIFILAILIVVGIYSRESPVEKSAVLAEAPRPMVSAFSSPSPLASTEKSPVPRPALTPPSVSTLREEVQKDVHTTPPSLIRFGAGLGARMKEAKQNQAAAEKLMGELKACAIPVKLDDSPVQARALCLVNARQLAVAWPDLSGEAQDIADHADPAAVQLAGKIK